MRKMLFVLLLSTTIFFGQEKSKYILKRETVNITFNKILSVKSFIQQLKYIPKSKNIQDYTEAIYFNNFITISDIKAETTNLTKYKNTTLSSSSIGTIDAAHENIFYSDSKYKTFQFPAVVDNSNVALSYNAIYKNPRLLSIFSFQDELDSDMSQFIIRCDAGIELGYKLYGLNTDKITFTKTSENGVDVYNWKMATVPAFEAEKQMQKPIHLLPHIVYHIKSYSDKGIRIAYLDSTKELYNWYSELIKQTNLKDQEQLKIFTLDLVQNVKSDKEKAKLIFEWIQKNLQYVAFEFAMGGFIPRDAVDVFEKKYGDCKDMANLTCQMFKMAGINASLTWIGTTSKPYAYSDITTPAIDDHMIASAKIDGIRYYFDATDKFCPVFYPSEMIQGKEALLSISNSEFAVDTVPTLESKFNKITYDFNVKFEQKKIIGQLDNTISGLCKSNLLNSIFSNPSKENEIWDSNVTQYNSKINLTVLEKKPNDYLDAAALIKYDLVLDDWTKNIGDNLVFKPLLLPFFSDEIIKIEDRKYDYNLRKKTSFSAQYTFTISESQIVEFIPKDFKIDNAIIDCEVKFRLEKNKIVVSQILNIKKVIIRKNDFQLWNESVKQILKISSQSILLKNAI